jgi:hypothetical protein
MPFSEEQFFRVFARYNEAVWPAQLVLYGLAITAVILAARGGAINSRYVSGALAVLCAWVALVYHATFFREINPAAILFAALFLVQAALFVWYGVICENVGISAKRRGWRALGTALIAYALFFYPFIATMSGQRYPAMPTFGLPCPTTIFTIGVLMWTRSTPPIVWIVPILWALISTQVAVQFAVYEDFGLTLAALAAVGFVFASRRTRRVNHAPGAV